MSEDISLLQEIDEALRADKAYNFWKKYGKIIIGTCAGIVVLTAVSAFWKSHLREQQMSHTHLMLKAATLAANAEYSSAPAVLEESKSWPASMDGMAKLQKADILFKAGKRDKAAELLKEVQASASVDSALKDLAALRLNMQTGEKTMGGADAQGKPFAVLASQLKAGQLLEEGKGKEAAAELNAMLAQVPEGSGERERAEELLQLSGDSK